jgi:hypothetical protein
MRAGEEISRRTAVLSGFDAEYQKSKDWTKALEYAQEVNIKTMFDYSKEAKPYQLLKHPSLRVIGQFQYYSLSLISHVAHQFYNTFRGSSPEAKSQARKELAYMMGTTAAMSGAMGMPLSAAAFSITDAIAHMFADDEEDLVYDSRLEFQKWMEEGGMADWMIRTVEEGAAGTFGAALSRRIGVASTLGVGEDTTPAHLQGTALWNYQLARYIGPSYAAIRDIGVGVARMQEGDYLKGMQLAAPKILKDFAKAARFQKDGGVKDFSGRRWSEGADDWDTVLLALGVNPYNYAQVQKKKRLLLKWDARITRQHGRMLKAMSQAYLSEDAVALDEAITDIANWNVKFPRLGVDGRQMKRAVNTAYKKELGIASQGETLLDELYYKN